MKVYITKYALTQGIIIEDVKDTTSKSMVSVTGRHGWCVYYHKPHWHRSWKEAVAQAEIVRRKRVASLQKSLAGMEALIFPATEPKEKP